MSIQVYSLIFCLLLTFIAHSQGLEFSMDNVFCGHLRCLADLCHNKSQIFSLNGLNIFEVTQTNTMAKLASVTVHDKDPTVDPSKINAISVIGHASRYYGDLTITFRDQVDCKHRIFMCEMEFFHVSRKPGVIREFVTSGYRTTNPATSDMQTKMVEQIIAQGNATETSIADLKDQNEVTEKQLSDVLIKLSRLEESLNTSASTCNMQMAMANQINIQGSDAQSDLAEMKLQNKATATELINVFRKVITIEESMSSSATIMNQLLEMVTQIKAHSVITGRQFSELRTDMQVLFDRQLLEQTTKIVTSFSRQLTEMRTEILGELSEIKNLSLDTTQAGKSQPSNIDLQDRCERGVPSPRPREKFLLWGCIKALCDTETDDGGWIVIQRRTKGDVDFYRDWSDYKNGFGTPDTDFWIGNDIIHNLTSQGYTELRVDLERRGSHTFAHYTNFVLGDEKSNYKLTVGGYSGTARDGLDYHNGKSFSTYDRDNDLSSGNNAVEVHGAWWYYDGYNSNLNGLWAAQNSSGVVWMVPQTCASFTEMKIRHV